MTNGVDLTDRQRFILKSIIEEYIETAEPVGSKVLEKKYALDVCPATIRNEMVKLTSLGYLKQPHTSAGRLPTSQALKLYINQLMKPKNLALTQEVAVKEKIWDARFELDKLLREATKTLAQTTGVLALATNDQTREIYFAGLKNILSLPEFVNLNLTRSLFEMLDDEDWWISLVNRFVGDLESYHILLGADWQDELLANCGYVFTVFRVGGESKGSIGVVGPTRLRYSEVIPTIQYVGDLISEIMAR